MVTLVPTGPEVGESEVMFGRTANPGELAGCCPAIATVINPVVAAAGTVVTIEVLLQLETAAGAVVPPAENVTELEPWVAPKFAPVIVTLAPTMPDDGVTALMPA